MFFFTNCKEQSSVRFYKERKIQTDLNQSEEPQSIQLQWDAPQSWLEEPPTRFRVGNYTILDTNTEKLIDLSIVRLSGEAGGIDANVSRWAGQIGIILPQANIPAFLASADSFDLHTGHKGIYVDFTKSLAGDIRQAKSIFGAIIPTKSQTIFVKAMGNREVLIRHKPKITTFINTLQIKESNPNE